MELAQFSLHTMEDKQERPVAYVSRTLSPAEKRYSQLEKEALAIVYAVKKFHRYVYGRHFEIESDHCPLSFLFSENKGVPRMASTRIQRWAITLFRAVATSFEVVRFCGARNSILK